MKKTTIIILLISVLLGLAGLQPIMAGKAKRIKTGNAIFIHPDGSGPAMWGALRMLEVGPDGMLNWDYLEELGVYRGHLTNSLSSSSNGAATAHALGVKAGYLAYGINPEKPFKSLSGKDYSIMAEAHAAGFSTAIINSGHICEPGSGVFMSNYTNRLFTDQISKQIINSGADIILSGGEVLLLPPEIIGQHGEPGRRQDSKNLIKQAEALGYTVVYTKDELMVLPASTDKVFGVFSAIHTFNDNTEEKLDSLGLPLFNPLAPTLAEMTAKALEILDYKGKHFLMVVEEEGTDNFSNFNNARSALEALRHADEAIGVVRKFIDQNPRTMLITAADSDAGGIEVVGVRDSLAFNQPLPTNDPNGAPIDGRNGTGTQPFQAQPDQFGNALFFSVRWSLGGDAAGGVVTKAHGLNAHLLPNNVDNTDIYRMMYATLFGVWLP